MPRKPPDDDELTPKQADRQLRILGGQYGGPMVEITQDIDLPPHIKLARDQHEYDPRVMADNSNIVFQATPKEKRQADRFMQVFFKNAKTLICQRCSGTEWRIFVDDGDDQPLMMLVCHNIRCGACYAPVTLRKAQITDAILKAAGLWIPE